jgi:hypothetical protein
MKCTNNPLAGKENTYVTICRLATQLNGGTVSQVTRFNDVEATKFQLLTGLIFANLADQTDDTDSSAQHRFNARLALEIVLQKSGMLELAPTDSVEIESGLRELRAKLTQLGERL